MLPGHAYLDVQFKGTSRRICDNVEILICILLPKYLKSI